jgi:aspartyl protease family protein
MWTALAAALLLLAAAGPASAQRVALSGRMGDKALLVIDGKPHPLAVGSSAGGVTLLRWAGDDAVEVQLASGPPQRLQLGAVPVELAGAAPRANGREIVLAAGPGGHFVTGGAINGRPVRFLVDTGATLVAMGRDDAQRLGLDLTSAPKAVTHTANGPVPVHLVTLRSVRVGDVELHQVGAAVLPQAMPVILLGNSFLSRLAMRRDSDLMRLELR